MPIMEVIQRANDFILANQGVQGDPDSVRLDRDGRVWTVFYHFSIFHPESFRKGDVMEGGEFILKVDDLTGTVSVFFPFFYHAHKGPGG